MKELLEAFCAGKSPNTLRAYSKDLTLFGEWLASQPAWDPRWPRVGAGPGPTATPARLGDGDAEPVYSPPRNAPNPPSELAPAGEALPGSSCSPIEAILRWLVNSSPGEANLTVMRWQESMRHLSSATINRRVAALSSLSRLAHRVGVTTFTLSVDRIPERRVRDSRGPRRDQYLAILEDAEEHPRDYAILRLLHDLGLRRSEVSQLDVKDYDGERIRVYGKTRTEWLKLPRSTQEAMEAYLGVRTSGPFFLSRSGRRFRPGKIAQMLYRRSIRVLGKPIGPHKIRHLAITTACDRTNGNMRRVMAFSRHRDPKTAQGYIDNWRDEHATVAELVAE